MKVMRFREGMKRWARRWPRASVPPPDSDAEADWMEYVGHIPDEAWFEIVEQLWANSRSFPTPDEVKAAWGRWLGSRPDRSTERSELPQEECWDCLGRGFLDYADADGYRLVCRCGSCGNWRRRFGDETVKRLSRAVLVEEGYRIVHPSDEHVSRVLQEERAARAAA